VNSTVKLLSVSLGLLATLFLGAPAKAQDTDYRRGLQLHLAVPSGTAIYDANGEKMFDDFLSGGFGASATFERGLTSSGAVRARVEYLAFGGKTQKKEERREIFDTPIYFSKSMDYSIYVADLAADYVYGFESLDAGLYVFGGLGCYFALGSGKFYGQDSDVDFRYSMEGGGASPGLSIGAGWRFTENKGCELRYTTLTNLEQAIKYRSSSKNQKIDLNWLQVSYCYRF